MYEFVRNCKDRFGSHVNTQTVVTSLNISTYTTCLRVYHGNLLGIVIIHTLRRYHDSCGNMILIHIMVKLLIPIDATFPAACGSSSTFVCTGQRLACVVALCCGVPLVLHQWSILPLSLRIHCWSRGVFFHLYSVFFRHVFLRPGPTLELYVWNKQNDSTSDTYVCYVCTSIFILYCTHTLWYTYITEVLLQV